MAEQQTLLGEYNVALAEVTRIIREQARLIEDNPSACIEYQRRINQERRNFAEAWNVILRIEVRTFQAEAQSSTPSAVNTGRQGQRQITFLPFEAPEIWRNSSDTFREFFLSLPHIPRDSLGREQRDKECNICYYPFFTSRGNVRDWTRARECELIVAVLTRIYQQGKEKRDVGGCQTKYIIISRTHD